MTAPIVRTQSNTIPEDARAEFIESFDGAAIRVIDFGGPGTRGDVVVVPGWTEPAEKYAETALDLIDRGFRVTCYDPRGQGLSHRLREDDGRGRIDTVDKHVEDLGAVIARIGAERLTLLGHSFGGLVSLLWMARGGRADCAVLSAPATRIFPGIIQRSVVSFLTKGLCRLGLEDMPLNKEGGQAFEFEGNTLTHDPDRHRIQAEIVLAGEDVLMPRTSPVMVKALHEAQDALHAPGALDNLTVPILIVSMKQDDWVNSDDHDLIASRSPLIDITKVDGARHEILMELDEYRDAFWDAFDRHTERYVPAFGSAEPEVEIT